MQRDDVTPPRTPGAADPAGPAGVAGAAGDEAQDDRQASFEERYTDLSEIGRGASAVVHRAFSPVFAREVAIKVFDGGIAEVDLRRRFRRECRVLGTLADHPHVVSVFDSGFTTAGQPYLVMAYCAGGSFGQRLAGQGPRPPEEAAVVGIAVADALDAAHARGIVHRDVKPQNVLLTSYGVVALADFGVAGDPGMDLRSFAATPGYVAPEVVLGPDRGGTAADIFALGATLYALLTGGPPLRPRPGEADIEFLLRSAGEEAPPLPPAVPPALARVVHACLARDPQERPADAATVRRLLRLAAVEDGLALPERLEGLPLPVSAGADRSPVPGATPPSTHPDDDGPAAWLRRVAVICLAGGLLAGGLAAGVALAPGGADDAGAVRTPEDVVTVTTDPDGDVRRQPQGTGAPGGGASVADQGGVKPSPGGARATTAPAVLPPFGPTADPTAGPTTGPTTGPTAEPPAVVPPPAATGAPGEGSGGAPGKPKPPKPPKPTRPSNGG